MRLELGKSKGFIIKGTDQELRKISQKSGVSFFSKQKLVKLPSNTRSYLLLRSLNFEYMSNPARLKMEALKGEYRTFRRKLNNSNNKFKKRKDTNIEFPLKNIPYGHQKLAYGFCSELDESALFMDTGTGKTLVAIMLIAKRYQKDGINKIFISCPKQVRHSWKNELKKHADFPFKIGMKYPPRGEGAKIWILNYDSIPKNLKRIKKWKPGMSILDESQKIKNRKTRRGKIVKQLKTKIRLIMSGTPIGKCISEAWNQVDFLRNDIFGTYSDFKDRYLRMGGFMNHQVVGYKNEQEFSDKLHSISFRVTKDECLDLPPIVYSRIYVEMGERSRKYYDQLATNYYIKVGGKEVMVDREISKDVKLRQLTGGRVLSNDQELIKVSGEKIKELTEYMEDRVDKKTLIYFSFTHELDQAEAMCKKLKIKYLRLSGSTKEEDRRVFEEKFQNDPSYKVALIQIATGGEGLTLVAADTVIFYSPTFSYLGYYQARDRVHRIGQVNKVNVIFFILENTIDERIVEVLESNFQLTDRFLEKNRRYKYEQEN